MVEELQRFRESSCKPSSSASTPADDAALKTDETQAVDETVDETQAVVLNQTTVFDWATMPLNLTKHGINKKTHLFCAPRQLAAVAAHFAGRVADAAWMSLALQTKMARPLPLR